MNELKTLKENTKYVINPDGLGFREFVEIKDLRAEAIKWIKALYKARRFSGNEDKEVWIKHFFNIADEELK